ncbi:MAG: DUF3857 domain-containing protein [Sphingomonas sp.]|uniref:DUF3857 domain-containing protein n=1 Tax=Sphingomonas sp. TaxID=28214 RepID=UPI0025E30A0D|nr:DUF3857 domain-containing protein [Sphingomonas sp.]MBX3566166.1 DUF3857 domain-containing protein [Sphingomonas sp.]
MLRKSLVLVAALCSCATIAHAGDKPLYQAAPAWVKPAPAIDAGKLSDADPIMLMLDQQQRVSEGAVWSYVEMAMRMASPQVLMQSGTIPLVWDPSKGDLIVHSVEIIRGTERIDVLAGGKRFEVLQREQQLENAALNGMLTATFAVEGIRVGDVLKVGFSITRKDPALNGHVQTIAPLIAEPIRLQFGRVRVMWPQAMNLRWRSYMKTADLKPVDTPDGFRELNLQMPVAKPAEVPSDAPLRYQPLPLLEATDYAGWADVSKGMAVHYRTEGTIAPGSPLAGEVAKIVAATSDPRLRAAMALQLVQDKVRYLFKGMDTGNYVPQAPSLTWSVRYGDCKAKSMLLLAMLRAMGIEAEAVLVSMDAGDLVPARLEMPGAFNHVIVHATIGGEGLWLDGTGAGARLSDIGDVPPFRHALPLRDGGAELLPMTPKPNARPTTDAEIEVDASAGVLFPAPFKARFTVRGQQAELLRVVAAQSDKDSTNKMIDAIIGAQVGTSSEIVDRSFKYDEATATALVTASGITYPEWKKVEGRFRVKLDPTIEGISFSPDRARPAWRDIPVSSGAYDDTRVLRRMHLPNEGNGFTIEGNRILPPMLAGVVLKRSVTLDSGWLTIEDRSVTGVGEIAPADIPATRAQVAQAKARMLTAVAPQGYPPLFRQIEAARRSKTLDPILAVYARQIAENPDEVEGYTDRAWFLERTYDRKAALRDVSKALELEPTAARYLWRARLYSMLNDDKAAMADARAALELEPASAQATGLVASLLASSGKRDDAITMISEKIDEGGDDKPIYQNALADLLADGGRVDEGLAILDNAIAAAPGKPDLLNSRCWMKGTRNVALESALKDCTKSIELSDDPGAALDSRGMVYFRMNRMEDALADFDAALEDMPDRAASLYMRGIIRKRSGAPDAEADLAAARLIAPRIDEAYGKYGIKP